MDKKNKSFIIFYLGAAVRKPAPWVPNTEAEDLLAAATEEEQKKLRPLIASLAPTSDHNAQIKAARATLFYVQDGNPSPHTTHRTTRHTARHLHHGTTHGTTQRASGA
jgi:hypothetical protein